MVHIGLLMLVGTTIASPLTSHQGRGRARGTSAGVPDYVLHYAPMVHLYSNEQWWPASIDTHLAHCVPIYNANLIEDAPKVINSSNAHFLPVGSTVDEGNIFYTSLDNVEDNPEWLLSPTGKPDGTGRSDAPTTIILVDKSDTVGPGVLDAYYFMFYSYNHGEKLEGARYFNHVADWECVTVRFQNGKPVYAFLSQSLDDGNLFDFDDLEKNGDRPVVYSAGGSHSLYPKAGTWDFDWTQFEMSDSTDGGPNWDLAAHYNAFWYSKVNGYQPAAGTHQSPNFLEFQGHWGDQQYSKHDNRQHCSWWPFHWWSARWWCHYIDGPTGPSADYLLRAKL